MLFLFNDKPEPGFGSSENTPGERKKIDFDRKGNGSWFTFGAGQENTYCSVGFKGVLFI